MDIRRTITLIDNAYHAQIGVELLSAADQTALAQFGQWSVDVGGMFDDGVLTFELPTKTRYFPKQFPVKAIFYLSTDVEASDQALLWVEAVVQRIVDAQTAALDKPVENILDTLTTYPEDL